MARILVADDAPAVLDVLQDALTLAGHEVIRATSGTEALRKFQETRPALAVLDVMMPDLDGLLVLESIRQVDAQVPVILITGVVGEALGRKVEHYRSVAFFEKGSGLDRFIELVNKTLGVPGKAGP
ncbi:MAG TPA: response regulator [Methylomirabilota bacterium]|jgi:CheY-like chemotaxis protein|nr:response regulator [Methylomirabilota bacterium]